MVRLQNIQPVQDIKICVIECKNWRNLNKKYGKDIVEKEVLTRFNRYPCNAIRILIISFLNVLTQPAVQLLKHHGCCQNAFSRQPKRYGLF
ncbi:MAG: hypothetical protein QXG39_01455 [Candidatus Aenigmatarchaeota archaeon]